MFDVVQLVSDKSW